MGIFSTIKDKIFGRKDDSVPAEVDSGAVTNEGVVFENSTFATDAAPAPAATGPVDVEAVLEAKMASKGNPDLNWRTSIVDLMKLLDLDSSLSNRKELAEELGYAGDKDGSAEMNIWLHREVMRQLAANGGTVPAGLME